ncbi:MAG: hypothetical protein HFI17_19200 [Lachnospiraceae bacterium]|nr:hypothetical protein [Lachnospiraceae bacterium]
MQPLIKITSVPIRTASYSQNARLVSSDSVDMERRKALARRMSFQRSAGKGFMPMKDITRINQTFSRRTAAAPKGQNISRQETAFRNVQSSVPQVKMSASSEMPSSDISVSDTVYTKAFAAVSMPVSSSGTRTDISMESSSAYTAELGALEMRVARGDLTFLPPMVMTIITQYPELHFEYLGEFNYVPPLDSAGNNINLFT